MVETGERESGPCTTYRSREIRKVGRPDKRGEDQVYEKILDWVAPGRPSYRLGFCKDPKTQIIIEQPPLILDTKSETNTASKL